MITKKYIIFIGVVLQPVALITGSARRIGANIATYLHSRGFRVVIHCNKSKDEANSLVRELNKQRLDSAMLVALDLNSEKAAITLIAKAIAWAGRMDVLVNNASIFSAEDSKLDNMLLVNVKIPFWLSKEAFSHLSKTNGCIINITDTHAKTPLKGYALYSQTKAALLMQTKALALDFAPKVRVNAVAPGAILWPEGDNSLSEEQRRSIIYKTPLKRHGSPDFIAKAVYSIIDNHFITGQELVVDGGRNI